MNIIDRAISYISPSWGLKRVADRQRIDLMDRRYEGAGTGRRTDSFLAKSNQSVNQIINKDLKNLVLRSRDLYRNNGYSKRAVRLIANNVVGTGILPTPLTGKPDLDAKIKEQWKLWADTTACDFDGKMNFYGLEKLAMKTVAMSGEVLAILKRVKSTVNPFGVQIQILEGDYIDITKNVDKAESGGFTMYGIEYGSDGKLTGYWILDRHPSEGNATSTFIKAENVIHVYEIDRPGQNRGVPFSASSLIREKDLDDYQDAEILNKKLTACYPVFVQNSDPSKVEQGGDNEPVESIEPGAVNYLNPGETVTFGAPPSNPGFESFVKTQQMAVAASYGVTYEQMTGDLSNVNFSSGRMGWIEFQNQVEEWQWQMLIPMFCEKAYKWFIDALKVIPGMLQSDTRVGVTWTCPRRQMIDPSKEVTALKDQARAGFISWQEIVRQLGYTPDDVIKEIKEDQDLFQQNGLFPEWNPLFVAKIQQLIKPVPDAGTGNSETKPAK